MNDDLTIERIIDPQLLTCPPDTPLSQAARRMSDAHCSSILIEHEGRILGIWTERDALALDLSDPLGLQAPVRAHMSAPVKTLPGRTRLGEAAVRFREERVRHFLVVDDAGRPQGLVSQSDIVINQGIEYYLTLREVHSVLRHGHQTVPSTASLAQAIQRMRIDRVDAVIVDYADGGHGILTERDVMRLIGTGRQPAQVGQIASRPLICVARDASLFHARKLFAEKHVRHLGVTGEDGRLCGMLTFGDLLASIEQDYIHQLRETLRERDHSLALAYQHQRLAAKVFESTLEGIMVTNARHVIESVNPAFTQITGYKAHEVVGQTPAILSSGRHAAPFYRDMREQLSRHGHWQGEIWNRRKNGEIYPEWLTINEVRNTASQVTNYVGVFSDITKRKAAEQRLAFLAHHDSLTSLPNRSLFVDRLNHALSLAQRSRQQVAVLFLDLDGFKPVNDTLGHHIGDQLLQIVAQRLVACVREADTVARLGGDEFTVVLESVAGIDAATTVARKINDAIAAPLTIDGHAVRVSASIGISLYPDHGDSAEALIQAADTAMYAAKGGGRNALRFFDPSLRAAEPLRRAGPSAGNTQK